MIVGDTSGGKSTLMRLTFVFEKPQKGAVYYDRKDVAKVALKSLWKHIGVMMQDGSCFRKISIPTLRFPLLS